MEDLQKAQNDFDNAVTSEEVIQSVSGLGTFLGFGGASISAIFHASINTILGFTSAGATSYAVSSLYGTRAQTAIYNAGLDALACINDATSPLLAHDATLKSGLKGIQDGETSVQSRLRDLGDTVSPAQSAAATVVLNRAADTERLIGEKIANEDTSAPTITSAIRAVVATVNKQLATAVPDATALARAGSSLGGQVTAGLPSAQNNKAPAKKTPSTALAPQLPGIRLARPNPNQNDELLKIYIDNLQADINNTSDVIASDVRLPAISCKVADAPAVTAIAVSLPPDSSGKAATGITYQTGQALSYLISGGTPPYMGVQWVGETPKCFSAVIHSPNALVLAPVTGASCTSGQSFSFDIYDTLGQHLSKPLAVTTK